MNVLTKLSFGLLFISSLFAQRPDFSIPHNSTGGGNGGQTFYKGKNAYLRDIVEKNNCIWKKYDQIFEEATKLNQILNKIYSLNSSFSLRIEEELYGLGYCFTEKRLPYLQYNNSDDIHIFANQEYDQVAINDSGIVFIDVNILKTMDQDNRAYLFMHEASHELFDKKESRSNREPRLREFLLNLFEQLDDLAENRKVDTFNYIVQNAKFTRLEDVTNLNMQDFEIIFSNNVNTSLEQKVSSLKSLGFKASDITSPTKETPKIYSNILRNNIVQIDQERINTINAILAKANLSSTKENFSNLVSIYLELAKYIYGDANKLTNIYNSIMTTIENNDLSEEINSLDLILKNMKLNKNDYYGGFIAKNYDYVFGTNTFLNFLAQNPNYLAATIFGQNIEIVKNYHCKGPGCGRQVGDGWTIVTYIYTLKSVNKYRKNEIPLLFTPQGASELSSYIAKAIPNNLWFAKKVQEILEADLNLLLQEGISKYNLPKETIVGDVLQKNSNYKSTYEFSGEEKKVQILKRQHYLAYLKSL